MILGFMEELSERENQLSRYKNKCTKLEKSYQTIHQENSTLQEALAKNDKDYNELHSHYDELVKHVQSLQEERTCLVNGYKKVKSEHGQMIEDISLLKAMIYKLNVQLSRYEDKLRINQSQDDSRSSRCEESELGSESRKIAESWGRVDTHVFAPLLEAYEENLREKEELIMKYRHEMDGFSGRCKDIIGENDVLRKEIEQYKSEVLFNAI